MNDNLIRKSLWQVIWATVATTATVATLVLAPFSVLLVPISEEFGWSRSETSGLISIFSLTAAVVIPFVGRLIDRFGTRRIVIPSALLTALGLGSLSILPDGLWAWMTVMGLLGVASAAVNGMPMMRLTARWVDKNRGIAMGVVGTGAALGQAATPAMVGLMASEWGWRGAFVALACFTLVVALMPVVFILRDPTPQESARIHAAQREESKDLPGYTFRGAMKTFPFWALVASTLVIGCAIPGALVHMVAILTDEGVTQTQAVAALSFAGLAGIGGRLIGGFLLDKLHAPFVAFGVFMLPIIGFVTLATGHGILALVGAILVGFALGAEGDLVGFLTSRYLGMKAFGAIYGLFYALLALGYSIGPAVFAWAYDFAGGYRVAFWIFGTALAVISVSMLLMGPYRYGHEKPVDEEPEAVSVEMA